jgi:acetoacetyl-CoA reductase
MRGKEHIERRSSPTLKFIFRHLTQINVWDCMNATQLDGPSPSGPDLYVHCAGTENREPIASNSEGRPGSDVGRGNMTRVAVVTGGTRGIGAAVSKALKAAGYQVAATYHSNDEAAEKFKAETGVHVYKWNAVIYDDCVAGLSRVEKDLGPVDVLVNNAGITRDDMFHKMVPDQWYSVIHTNLNSLFNMCRPVIEGMRERGFGRIINISSVNGQKGQIGQSNYSASKAGDIGFTKALALENATKGITVNAICPGYIATEMLKAVTKEVLDTQILPQIPVRRLGEPEEVARCVVFLASDDAGFITGSTLSVNGGGMMT